MSRFERRAARIAAAIAVAALVSACAAAPSGQSAESAASELTKLTGLDRAAILVMLGRPDLKRDEPPAELWQYRAADCVLNFFFYRQASGDYRLLRAESWQRRPSRGGEPARCRDENAALKAQLLTQSSL